MGLLDNQFTLQGEIRYISGLYQEVNVEIHSEYNSIKQEVLGVPAHEVPSIRARVVEPV